MDADDRAVGLPDARVLREQGRHMGVRADAQEQDVEGRDRRVVLRDGRLGQLPRVRRRCGLRVRAVRAVGGRHRVHPLRVQRHRVQQGFPRLGDVALRVALGQEAFVAPPQVDAAPVHRVPGRGARDRGQQTVAVAAAGEDHGRRTPGGLRVHDLRDQPCRRGLGHQFLVAVHDKLGSAHFAAAFFTGAFSCAASFAGAFAAVSTGAGTARAPAPSPESPLAGSPGVLSRSTP